MMNKQYFKIPKENPQLNLKYIYKLFSNNNHNEIEK